MPMLKRGMPILEPLCQQPISQHTMEIITVPALFQRMAAHDPSAAIPLQKLWDVYVTHGDLIDAFHVNDDESARSLLQWRNLT